MKRYYLLLFLLVLVPSAYLFAEEPYMPPSEAALEETMHFHQQDVAAILESSQTAQKEAEVEARTLLPSEAEIAEAILPHKVEVAEMVTGIQTVQKKTQEEAVESACPGAVAAAQGNDASSEARYPTLLVMVSLNMPRASLEALSKQLEKVGGALVLRGIPNNDLMHVQEHIQGLSGKVMIDPTLFRAYQVESVPTYILQEEPPLTNMETAKSFDKLVGNVSLYHALEQFTQHGETSHASVLLDKLRGKQQ